MSLKEEMDHVAVELALEPQSAARARAIISSLETDADSSSLDHARLLASELIADALATEPRSQDAAITVEAQMLDGTNRVMVAFHGLALDVPADTPEPAAPGWGIHLVRTLANRWGIQRANGSTYVWFEA
ncbi:MAG: ATP-binding protein [Solirubrobacterales bacterium]